VAGEGTKASFVRWVESYMLKAKPLGCTAIDLYAARCGIVHSMSAESDLSRQDKAARILYVWGTAKPDEINQAGRALIDAGEKAARPNDVAVHISDLIDAFKLALKAYMEEIAGEPERQADILRSGSIWLGNLPRSVLTQFLAADGG
jgi:hypothetical protein